MKTKDRVLWPALAETETNSVSCKAIFKEFERSRANHLQHVNYLFKHAGHSTKLDAVVEPAEWTDIWDDSVVREPSVSYLRARANIDAYVAEDLISVQTADRAHQLVENLFDKDTVFATVAPDDGDLIFYWRAGSMSIEIDIYSDPSEGYWWAVNNVAAYTDSGQHPYAVPGGILSTLRHSLAHFSKEVDRVNRHWRAQRF